MLRGVADTVGDSQDAQKIKDEANRFTPTGQIKKKYIKDFDNFSDFPQSESYFNEAITIPLYPSLENSQQERVIELLNNY